MSVESECYSRRIQIRGIDQPGLNTLREVPLCNKLIGISLYAKCQYPTLSDSECPIARGNAEIIAELNKSSRLPEFKQKAE